MMGHQAYPETEEATPEVGSRQQGWRERVIPGTGCIHGPKVKLRRNPFSYGMVPLTSIVFLPPLVVLLDHFSLGRREDRTLTSGHKLVVHKFKENHAKPGSAEDMARATELSGESEACPGFEI